METTVRYNGKVYVWRRPHRVEIASDSQESNGSIVRIFWGDKYVVFRTRYAASVGDYNEYEPSTIVEGALPEREGVVGWQSDDAPMTLF